MKKRLVLLMALGLALLLTACGGGSGGKGSAHPYSWKEKGDGSVQLTVQNAPEEGYNWNVESGGAAQAARLDDGTKNKAVFSVTGQDAGQGTVQLSCRREQAPHDVSFQILLTVQTGETGKASLTQADFQAFPAAGSAGEEGKARCVWYVDTDGGTKVYLGGGDGAYDWAVLDDDTAVLTVSGPEYDDEGGCTYQLDGVAAGETTLTLYDLRQDYGFQLQVTVDEEQSVSVASGQAGTFAVASSQVPDMDRAEELLGTLSFPQDVRVLQCRVGNWNGGEPDNYARLTLKDQAGRWQLVASKAFSA